MYSRFTVYGTIHNNSEKWMTNLDAQGYGAILEEDLQALLEKSGFTVTQSKTFQYEGKLTPSFIEKGRCPKMMYSSRPFFP